MREHVAILAIVAATVGCVALGVIVRIGYDEYRAHQDNARRCETFRIDGLCEFPGDGSLGFTAAACGCS